MDIALFVASDDGERLTDLVPSAFAGGTILYLNDQWSVGAARLQE
jgi:hypothetical protein